MVLDDDGPNGMMFAEADLLVLLDYPRWLSFQWLLRSSVNRVATQIPICNGNYESWGRLLSQDSQLLWHLRTWERKRRLMRDLAAQNPERALLFSRPSELTAWIKVFRRFVRLGSPPSAGPTAPTG